MLFQLIMIHDTRARIVFINAVSHFNCFYDKKQDLCH